MTAYMNVLITDSINWDEVKENNLISELDYNKYKFQIRRRSISTSIWLLSIPSIGFLL
jgi:hypothetical protein